MKAIPLSPLAAHTRFMAAFCRDIASGDVSKGKTPQADAVAEIVRQQRAYGEDLR